MNMQTPSQDKTTQTQRREPGRWLIPAALLLIFLAICCIGQVVILLFSPRNAISQLNLLSNQSADYQTWSDILLPPIADASGKTEVAEQRTQIALSSVTPTPVLLADVPTEEVVVIEAPVNAPTTTPVNIQIALEPTATPRPFVSGPTATPAIRTPATAPSVVAAVNSPTPSTESRATATNTVQPTRNGGPSPTRVAATATNTRVPEPPTATDTPRPAPVPSRTPTSPSQP